ncbi:MAG TPA: ATP-binding protein, partial [Verrucomicrobiae bacterium]|nr:ATP-binding protein [Verrucomicrobiae bacterium]
AMPQRKLSIAGYLVTLLLFLSLPGYAQDDDASRAQMAAATNYLKNWIWDKQTQNKQTIHLWHSFRIPPHTVISRATIYLTVDNGYRLFLDGRELGQGSDWKTITEYDVRSLLGPGEHVIGVEAFNERLNAGLMFALEIETTARPIEVLSDESWRVVPLEDKDWATETRVEPNWPTAVVVGKANTLPWKPWPYAIVSLPPLRPIILHFWQMAWFQITLLSLLGIAVIICVGLVTQLTARAKAERLLHLQRARIARDIHDDLGVRLTQLVLLGELAQNELPSQSDTRSQIDRICEQARDLGQAMDEIVWAVSSRRDTLRDFAAFVCRYAQWFCQNTELRCRFDVEDELPPEPFDLAIRRNLLLAVKEAVNNAVKHSGANELFLRIYRNGDGVFVAVEDNGRGFYVSQADWLRNGLTNMSQRMEEIGGKFLIHSAPGMGCRVEFYSPLTLTRRRWRWLNRLWPEEKNLPADESDNGLASPSRSPNP